MTTKPKLFRSRLDTSIPGLSFPAYGIVAGGVYAGYVWRPGRWSSWHWKTDSGVQGAAETRREGVEAVVSITAQEMRRAQAVAVTVAAPTPEAGRHETVEIAAEQGTR